ncbi:MAG TPA: trypsin-like peptidase domain-containing protein [Burkholderiaceae bacterium]|nr:trypsin-like peptidase domain-containing protein [Burkholderiaceae bacterium]
MLRRLWLLFAQATTVGLALLFVVATLKPEWLKREPVPARPAVVERGTTKILQAPPAERLASTGLSQSSYAEAALRAQPSVVSVYALRSRTRAAPTDDPLFERFFGDRDRSDRSVAGSGVIATADGYVLTNNHVVESAEEIAIGLPGGRRAEAKLVGADPETDLAVLKVALTGLPAITFGHAENLRVGDIVLAIGNPFEVGQTVTMGIVSALGRNDLGINRYENFIQTDAAINLGNSGGALVDTDGNLVGINTAIYSRSGGSVGIGFAIPTTIISHVMDQLIRTGKVTRGYFGIEPADVTPELAEMLKLPDAKGVVVRMVERSAPAGRAGMEPLDVVQAINGEPVVNTPGMLAQIAQLAPGSSARVTVLRKGRAAELNITVGERPQARR